MLLYHGSNTVITPLIQEEAKKKTRAERFNLPKSEAELAKESKAKAAALAAEVAEKKRQRGERFGTLSEVRGAALCCVLSIRPAVLRLGSACLQIWGPRLRRELLAPDLSWCGSSISGLEWTRDLMLRGCRGTRPRSAPSALPAGRRHLWLAARRRRRLRTTWRRSGRCDGRNTTLLPNSSAPLRGILRQSISYSEHQLFVWLTMHCLISGARAYPNATTPAVC